MRQYIAIDLKSFYASVECAEMGLDPLTTRLVVADESRTAKTICLAVSPALKAYGIPGRPRLFEVIKRANEAKIDFITAPPRMSLYMDYSAKIFDIYLRYVAKSDMHVYSVDEVFIDITEYLKVYNKTAPEIAMMMINDVLNETKITATAGIGTNMYLAKIAMDIVAKHAEPDKNGVRLAVLDEMSYRKLLWEHTPITDFWRVGKGISKKLKSVGLYTMGDVARCSLGRETEYYNEDLLYRLFGVNAELLIDHAWGYEPCLMFDIKQYRPQSSSISSGQVLHEPYNFENAKLIVKEMMELLALDLVSKRIMTKQIVLTVGYDIENLSNEDILSKYEGNITIDRYGRKVPEHAHGTENLEKYTSAGTYLMDAAVRLYDRIVNPDLLIRRITITAANVVTEEKAAENNKYEQMDLFRDFGDLMKGSDETSGKENKGNLDIKSDFTYNKTYDKEKAEKEKKLQQAALDIKKKYGKNAVLKGMNLEEAGTTMKRNAQIGGHKA